jgi:ABC-2 type transport system permease protein
MVLQRMLTHRVDFLLMSLFAPVYVLMLLGGMEAILSQVNSLGGWSAQEIRLAFAVLMVMISTEMLLFFSNVRDFMWNVVRDGELDMLLVKPADIRFLALLAKPSYEFLLWCVGSLVYFCIQLQHTWLLITPINFALFCVVFLACFVVNFFVLSTYATASFYMSKAQQLLELYDKATDLANYPTHALPMPLQTLSWTVLATVFYAYVPTLVLTGRANAFIFASIAIALLFFGKLQSVAWKRGLQNYASASS